MTQKPQDDRPARFLTELRKLDRGPLAQLRRGLGGDDRSVYWLEGLYARTGYGEATRTQKEALQLLAGLYALKPSVKDDGDFDDDDQPKPETSAAVTRADRVKTIGRLMGRLYLMQEQRPSTEKRFLALLDADRDGLNYQMRQAVALLDAGDLAPDWERLTRDLLHWGDGVRRQWAQDFYQETAPKQASRQDADQAAEEPAMNSLQTQGVGTDEFKGGTP